MWKYGILQFTVLFFACWNWGGLLGLLATALLVIVLGNILRMFGYHPVNFLNLGMSFEAKDCTNNLVSYFEVGKLTHQQVKDRIYNAGIKKVPTMRYTRSDFLGVSFFKDSSEDLALKQVKKLDRDISSDKGVVDYCTELGQKKLPFDKPLWEVHVLEDYAKDKSIVFFVIQHQIMDTVGFVSLMSALLDNQFSLTMKKKNTPVTWYWDIVYLTLGPLYTVYLSIFFKMMKSDEGASKLCEKTDTSTYQKNLYTTQELDFDKIMKCYKRFKGVTFGDYFMGVVSKALNAWYEQHNIHNAKQIKTAVSVNMRNYPTDYKSIVLGNFITVFEMMLPIEKNMQTAITKAKTEFRKYYSETASFLMHRIFHYYTMVPQIAVEKLSEDMLGGVDCVISNVPFSTVPWKFCGQDVGKRAFWAHGSQHLGLFILPITYGNKLRIQFSAHKHMKMSAQNLVSQLEKVVNDEISQVCK